MIFEHMECSEQTVQLSGIKVSTITKQTESSFHLGPRHLGVSLGAPKMISEPMVRLAQTVHYLALTPNGPKRDSTRPKSPSSYIGCVKNDF
jgi:hypothetical protein